jgi:hypothetical protein
MRRGTLTLPETAEDVEASSAAGATRPHGHSEPGQLRTEFTFLLPRGYVDNSGTVHREGVMRLATARDELIPLRDDRVRENSAYLTVVLLARVIMRIGTIEDVHAGVIENLFAADLAFAGPTGGSTRRVTRAAVTCPSCSHRFAVDVSGGRLGES